jgi:serine/threonine protein kinase
MKKIIWQNLLNHAKNFNEAAQPHVALLEKFLTCTEAYTRRDSDHIEFHEFTDFAVKNGASKNDLLDGPAGKLFRALDDQIPEQTLCFDVDTHTVIYHFKDKTRTDIYNIEIDLDSYILVKELGVGTNGTVRLYQNSKRQVIALKTPNPIIPHNGYIAGRKRDIEIAKRLYPDDGLYWVNEHTREVLDAKGQKVSAHGFYVVIPYIHGENFSTFCSKLKTKAELLETLTAISVELQRIHELGIIHGDINPNNILLWHDSKTDKVCVRFIDFEWSYYRHSEKARMTTQATPHWAPERIILPETNPDFADESFEIERPDAHPEQDVFSFGHMIWAELRKHALVNSLPLVHKYCSQFLQHDPKKRPLLESFIFELDREAKLETTHSKIDAMKSTSSTEYFMRLGIAGKNNVIYDNFFVVAEPQEKSEPQDQVKLVTNKALGIFDINQNYFNVDGMAKPAPVDVVDGPQGLPQAQTVRH